MAPNQPDPAKRIINARVDRELYEKIRKLAAMQSTSLSNAVIAALSVATQNIKLTAEDYENIAKDIRAAKNKS